MKMMRMSVTFLFQQDDWGGRVMTEWLEPSSSPKSCLNKIANWFACW